MGVVEMREVVKRELGHGFDLLKRYDLEGDVEIKRGGRSLWIGEPAHLRAGIGLARTALRRREISASARARVQALGAGWDLTEFTVEELSETRAAITFEGKIAVLSKLIVSNPLIEDEILILVEKIRHMLVDQKLSPQTIVSLLAPDMDPPKGQEPKMYARRSARREVGELFAEKIAAKLQLRETLKKAFLRGLNGSGR